MKKRILIVILFCIILKPITIALSDVSFPTAGQDRKPIKYDELTKEEQAAIKIFKLSILDNDSYLLSYLISDSVKNINGLKKEIIENDNFKRCVMKEKGTYLLIEKSKKTGNFSIEMPIESDGGVALRLIFKKEGRVFKLFKWAHPC